MLEIIDITPSIENDMDNYPGLIETKITKSESIEKGDKVNVTNCSFCSHVGLHVDAPCHHIEGDISIEDLNLSGLVGKAYIMNLTDVNQAVTANDLKALDKVESFDILILKTKNSTSKTTWDKFDKSHIYISEDGARDIILRGIKGVAIDCLSVEQFGSKNGSTHKILLKNNKITVIEGVDLRNVEPGFYWFACLPLKIVGSDGSPARAILIKDNTGIFIQAWEEGRKK